MPIAFSGCNEFKAITIAAKPPAIAIKLGIIVFQSTVDNIFIATANNISPLANTLIAAALLIILYGVICSKAATIIFNPRAKATKLDASSAIPIVDNIFIATDNNNKAFPIAINAIELLVTFLNVSADAIDINFFNANINSHIKANIPAKAFINFSESIEANAYNETVINANAFAISINVFAFISV